MVFREGKKRGGKSAYSRSGRFTANGLQSGDVRDELLGLGNALHFQPRDHHEGFMRPVFTVPPTFGDGGIEKFRQQPVRIYRFVSHFQKTSALELGETLQFAAREAS